MDETAEPAAAGTPSQSSAAIAGAIFTSLDKYIRTLNLYAGRGKIVDRSLADLQRHVESLEEGQPLTMEVTALGLRVDDQLVTPQDRRVDYLFKLYCDGVRELSLVPPLPSDELRQFAELLRSDFGKTEEDLVTLLWQRQFRHIRYYAGEAFSEGVVSGGEESELLQVEAGNQLQSAESGEELNLTAEDARLLIGDQGLAWLTALPRGPEAADRPESAEASPVDYETFMAITRRLRSSDEASALLTDLYQSLIQTSNLEGVTTLLGSMSQDESMRSIVLEEERLEQLALLYTHHWQEVHSGLRGILASEPEGLLPLLNALEPGDAAESLERALSERDVDLAPFYARDLQSSDEETLLRAVEALGRVGTEGAVEALVEALSHELSRVRRQALKAMSGRYHASARIPLGRLLRDPDKENRMMALLLLGRSGDKRSAWPITSAMTDHRFSSLDTDEQQAFYDAIATLKDPKTLDPFKKLLAKKSMVGGKGLEAQQSMAVGALQQMGIPEARAVLEEAAGRWGLSSGIKQRIQRALAEWRDSP